MEKTHIKTKYMPWKVEYEELLKTRKKRSAGGSNPPQLVFDLLDVPPLDSNGNLINDNIRISFSTWPVINLSNEELIDDANKIKIAKGRKYVNHNDDRFTYKYFPVLPYDISKALNGNEYNLDDITDKDKWDMVKAGLIVDKANDIWKIDTTNFIKERKVRHPNEHLAKNVFRDKVEHHGELTLHHGGKIHNVEDNLSAGDILEFKVAFVGEMVNATTRSGQSTTSINTLGNQIDENVINQNHLVQYNTTNGVLTINLAKPLAGGVYDMVLNLQASDTDNVDIFFFGTTSQWNTRREYAASTTANQGVSDKTGQFLDNMDLKQLARMFIRIFNNGTSIDVRHDFMRYPAIGASESDTKYYRHIGTSQHVNTLDNTKPVFENAIKIKIAKINNGGVSPLTNGFITFTKLIGVK